MKNLFSVLLAIAFGSASLATTGNDHFVGFESFDGADKMAMAEIAEQVDVREVDVRYGEGAYESYYVFVKSNFMPNPHESSFDEAVVPPGEFEAYRNAFVESLIAKAETASLPAGSLRIALMRIGARATNQLLPIAAYIAWNGKAPIWVILCKLVSPLTGQTAHLNVFGYTIATGVQEFSVPGGSLRPQGLDPDTRLVIRITHDRSYFRIENLDEAATTLRDAAAEIGADLNHIPQYRPADMCKYGSDSTAVLNLPAGILKIPASELITKNALTNGTAEYWGDSSIGAYLLLSRPLTIEETAQLLEGGVRIVGRISRGYYVEGRLRDLNQIASRDYVTYILEYSADLKTSGGVFRGHEGTFVFVSFSELRPAFEEEAGAVGMEVVPELSGKKSLYVLGTPDQARRLAMRPWVRAVIGETEDHVDSIEMPKDTSPLLKEDR